MNTLGGPLANSSTRSECKVPLFHVSAVPALLKMGHGLGLNKRLLSNFPVDQSSLAVPAPLVFSGSMGKKKEASIGGLLGSGHTTMKWEILMLMYPLVMTNIAMV